MTVSIVPVVSMDVMLLMRSAGTPWMAEEATELIEARPGVMPIVGGTGVGFGPAAFRLNIF